MRTTSGMRGLAVAAVCALLLLVAAGVTASHEPRFHVRPPANWINDANGPYRDPITGKMHLYMQYNPSDAVWGEINWYHFTSRDYVLWEDRGIALKNDKPYDHWGAYTGTITHNPDGTPVLIYTCTAVENQQRQCIAVPPLEDISGADAPRTLDTFVKLASNPVLKEEDVPNLYDNQNYRDPTNVWEDPTNSSRWLVALAARRKGEGIGDHGHVVVFSTEDPTWRSGFKYSHSLWHEVDNHYHMLECPDFFKVGTRHYLKVSTMVSQQDVWVYGDYQAGSDGKYVYVENTKLTPTYADYGRWYAAKHNFDTLLGRAVLWGWLVEEDTDENARERGWSGMMDMPRYVEYDTKAKKLKTFPMPQLEKLRGAPLRDNAPFQLRANESLLVAVDAGRHYELVVDFTVPEEFFASTAVYEAGKAPSFGVDVLTSADGETRTRIAVTMPATAGKGVGQGMDQTGRQYNTVEIVRRMDCPALCAEERRCVGWTTVDLPFGRAKCTLMSTWGESVSANQTSVTGRVNEPVILLDRNQSLTTGSTEVWVGRAPLWNGAKVQLRVFVDETTVQVFKDGGLESLSGRVYLDDPTLTGVYLFSSNMEKPVKAVASLYPMRSVIAPGVGDASAGPAAALGGVALLVLLAAAQLLSL